MLRSLVSITVFVMTITTTVHKRGSPPNTKFRSVALERICIQHGTTIHDAGLMVCQGRKKVYVLCVGEIHSPNCFLREQPTSSFRSSAPPENASSKQLLLGSTTLVPDGWKVASIVENNLWVAEVKYAHSDIPTYQFSKINDDGEVVERSTWHYTPSAAFRQNNPADKSKSRQNGKLFLGVNYENPQHYLRNVFRARLLSYSAAIQQVMEPWLAIPMPMDSSSVSAAPAAFRTRVVNGECCKKSRLSDDEGEETLDHGTSSLLPPLAMAPIEQPQTIWMRGMSSPVWSPTELQSYLSIVCYPRLVPLHAVTRIFSFFLHSNNISSGRMTLDQFVSILSTLEMYARALVLQTHQVGQLAPSAQMAAFVQEQLNMAHAVDPGRSVDELVLAITSLPSSQEIQLKGGINGSCFRHLEVVQPLAQEPKLYPRSWIGVNPVVPLYHLQ